MGIHGDGEVWMCLAQGVTGGCWVILRGGPVVLVVVINCMHSRSILRPVAHRHGAGVLLVLGVHRCWEGGGLVMWCRWSSLVVLTRCISHLVGLPASHFTLLTQVDTLTSQLDGEEGVACWVLVIGQIALACIVASSIVPKK